MLCGDHHEIYASFEFHRTYVVFQLGGMMRRLSIREALELWKEEEQNTNVFVTILRDFSEDVSVYWSHISRDGSPFIQL